MIARIYIDNYRSFVNFEWKPGRLALMLGENGSGKTHLVGALAAIQDLVAFKGDTRQLFLPASRTRWDQRTKQTFELDLRTAAGLYSYKLVIDFHPGDEQVNLVDWEALSLDGQALIEVEIGEVRLFGKDGRMASSYTMPWQHSGVGLAASGDKNPALREFKQRLDACWFLHPDPRQMSAEVAKGDDWLRRDMDNFATWYLGMLQQKPGTMFKATQALQRSIPDLEDLGLDPHDKRRLLVSYGGDAPHSLAFDELSEGQRALIALHSILHALMVPGKTIILDEPDNYVGLREIQSWLDQVIDRCLEPGGPQVWLISHHPEVLNPIACDHGWGFSRARQGPTRVARYQPHPGLTPAETQARGWQGA